MNENNVNKTLDDIYNILNNIYIILDSYSQYSKANTTDYNYNSSSGSVRSFTDVKELTLRRCVAPRRPSDRKKHAILDENVRSVFEFYCLAFPEHRPSLTTYRKKVIKKCVQDFGAEACYKAIYNVRVLPFFNGDNRWNKTFTGIDFIFDRDYKHVPEYSENLDRNLRKGVPDAIRYNDCIAEFHAQRAGANRIADTKGSQGSDGHGQTPEVAGGAEHGTVPVLSGTDVSVMEQLQRGGGSDKVEDVQHQ